MMAFAPAEITGSSRTGRPFRLLIALISSCFDAGTNTRPPSEIDGAALDLPVSETRRILTTTPAEFPGRFS